MQWGQQAGRKKSETVFGINLRNAPQIAYPVPFNANHIFPNATYENLYLIPHLKEKNVMLGARQTLKNPPGQGRARTAFIRCLFTKTISSHGKKIQQATSLQMDEEGFNVAGSVRFFNGFFRRRLLRRRTRHFAKENIVASGQYEN